MTSPGKVILEERTQSATKKAIRTTAERSGGAGELVRYSTKEIDITIVRMPSRGGSVSQPSVNIRLVGNSDWSATCTLLKNKK